MAAVSPRMHAVFTSMASLAPTCVTPAVCNNLKIVLILGAPARAGANVLRNM